MDSDFASNIDDKLHSYLLDDAINGSTPEKSGGNAKYVPMEDKVAPKEYAAEVPTDAYASIDDFDPVILIYCELREKGIAGDAIRSMNSFSSTGIRQITTQLFTSEVNRMKNERDKTEEDRDIDFISFKVEFTDVNIKPPVANRYASRASCMATPNMARLKSLTYSAPMFLNMRASKTAHLKNGKTKTVEETLTDVNFGAFPVMVLSNCCNTAQMSKEARVRIEEDPLEPGGYFIVKGSEWCVDHLENILINGFHVYRNMHNNEIARGDFISKPGDAYENSFRILLRYLNSGAITLELQTNKFDKLEIPFFLLFRAFGMTSDRDIVDNIVYGVEGQDPVTIHMLNVLERAFHVVNEELWGAIKDSTDSNEILLFIGQRMDESIIGSNYRKEENAVKYLLGSTLGRLDKYIFPHIGSDSSSRIRKLRFLGHLIHKLLLVEMEILESSDRDNYKNKRVHSPGVSLAKTFKAQFNFIVVQEIKKRLIKDFKNIPFSAVNLSDSIRAAIKKKDLEKGLVQSIVTGNKTLTVKRNEMINRVSSQQLYRKNDLNIKSTLRTINSTNSTSAKQTERADEMRRVHASTIGFICPMQSADTGEKVGMSKQMACSASVAEASSSYVLKDTLAHDRQIIDLNDVKPAEITARKLSKVFVNGDWIGLCERGWDLVRRYRLMRRHEDIHPLTTICWEELVREIYFWVDVGRLIRPLIIVYNNIEEYVAAFRRALDPNISEAEREKAKSVKFRQWIKLTPEHIAGLRAGTITMEMLRKDRVIEYISPEEQINAFLCPDLETFKLKSGDVLYQYTHMDIPQATLGILALSACNANHTQGVRTTHLTNQKKQTCGWFALNWPYRIDKNTFLQYYCQKPVAPTFTDSVSYPNGQNLNVALALYTGYNQEDSGILNSSSIDRGALNGCHFYVEKSEAAERGEEFGPIDLMRTMDVKKDANYEFIGANGLIKEGTKVHKGTVLISKYAKIARPTDDFVYVDRSVVYKSDEEAEVIMSFIERNDDDILMAKVGLRTPLNLQTGDKISSREGNKNIVSLTAPSCDMMFAEDGSTPDLIINPHSVPTRMCIGQLMEMTSCTYALRRGCLIDTTIFRKHDISAQITYLEERGIKFGGHRRMYNGMTGEFIDVLIFFGNTYYNRLQKFVALESYAINRGPTNALTRQPLEGKQKDGGLKLGEMETWTLAGAGALRAESEKLLRHSDGVPLYYCRYCGQPAIVNTQKGKYECKRCRDLADIAMVESTWTANIFAKEIESMGVKVQYEVEPIAFLAEKDGS